MLCSFRKCLCFFFPTSVLSIDPVIGAISAGNAVVLKPSEIAPATSSILKKLLSDYLDNSAIRVIEGAIPETTALLEQKWDKILYTGNFLFLLHHVCMSYVKYQIFIGGFSVSGSPR